MNILLIVGVVLLWLLIGIYTAGKVYAHFQLSFPTIAEETRRADTALSWVFISLGLISFIAAVLFFTFIFRKNIFKYPWILPGKRWE